MNRRHAGQVGIEALVVAPGWAILAALLLRNRDFLHDDAFISLRYARHLAEYGVLEWNLGERVEGYTNFLHVLLTAGLIRLDIPPIWAAQGLNIAALAGLIVLQARALRMALPGPEHAMLRSLTVLVTAAVPGLAVWALGGLEAPFLAALLLGGVSSVLAAERGDGRWGPALAAALWLSAAVLTRMDAAVFIVGLAFGVALFGSGRPLVRFGRATLVAALPAAVALAHMGWRFSYYGEALPLTFHAKIGTALGLRLAYLPEFLAQSLPWLAGPVLSATLAVLVAATGRAPRLVGLIALPVGFQLGYIGYSGGDHMIAGRVLVPLVAPLLLLGAVAFSGLGKSLAIGGAGAVAAVSAAAIVLVPPLRMDPAAFVGQIVGRHIAATWPGDSLVALHTAGSTPFHADTMTFIDGLGLNDPVIARRESFPLVAPMQRLPGHSKGDGAYVLSRAPDFVILGPAEGTTLDRPWFLGDAELAAMPAFARCYVITREEIPYSDAFARRGPSRPRPLIFTYYRRICP
ncbi:hypothetical protein [Rhodovulum marinum]|uniref:Dolichyl-phosphate-mannose-protein mannosyltransferase n=1 Tax=Rhodovulum marinum TaxID=320662 RepID=A0A4R2Q3J0_9RHOB|nr:hypothetical protein [Rhodovulum marinum]TCP42278.1 hypothetical protein EV662_103185 [Rhodovulum marinum]